MNTVQSSYRDWDLSHSRSPSCNALRKSDVISVFVSKDSINFLSKSPYPSLSFTSFLRFESRSLIRSDLRRLQSMRILSLMKHYF